MNPRYVWIDDTPTTGRPNGYHRQIDIIVGDWREYSLWPGWRRDGHERAIVSWARKVSHLHVVIGDLPAWFIESWHAGEPVGPLIDWMIENRPDHADWLQRVAALLVEAGRE